MQLTNHKDYFNRFSHRENIFIFMYIYLNITIIYIKQ